MQLRAAAALQLPVIVTEQYPKALGPTVEELQGHIPEGSPGAPAAATRKETCLGTSRRLSAALQPCPEPALTLRRVLAGIFQQLHRLRDPPFPPVVAKTLFSMCTDEVNAAFDKLPGVKKVLIVGIETHVCVLQTSLDLLGAPGGGP